jgi:hypothetical protein
LLPHDDLLLEPTEGEEEALDDFLGHVLGLKSCTQANYKVDMLELLHYGTLPFQYKSTNQNNIFEDDIEDQIIILMHHDST